MLFYPMLDLLRLSLTDATVAGSRYAYTLASYRALLDRHVVLRDDRRDRDLRRRIRRPAARDRLRDRVADRRRTPAPRRPARSSRALAVVSAWVIPGVLAGVIWKILLIENRSGIVNYYLAQVGLGPLPLISSPMLALVSVVVANVWRGCAFSMILLYAGLQRVPRELHEAADLEGVSAWQRLRWLLIPQLAPVIALNLVLITIASFNTFDLIIPLTAGGPARRTEVISLFMYRLGFFDLAGGARRGRRGRDARRQSVAGLGGRPADHARRAGAGARWRHDRLRATARRSSSPAWRSRPRRSCCRSSGCSRCR